MIILRDDTRMHSSRMRTVCSSVRISEGCLLPGGVCSVGGGVSAPMGVSAPGGSAPGEGVVVSQHALRQTPPPPCGQTDACKNITFATSLRTVINQCNKRAVKRRSTKLHIAKLPNNSS